jgi:N utilization substance protein A
MTSEELDELIEKAVGEFTQIESVDTELAEKLVEQGILSFDDLSVMEITDLVNTIDGLTEELAEEIRSKAETLAEAAGDEGPRRKGAKSQSSSAPRPGPEAIVADEVVIEGEVADGSLPVDALPVDEVEAVIEETGEEPEDTEMRDLAIAAEEKEGDAEVTSVPSNDDQDETARIVTDAVASAGSGHQHQIEAHAAGEGLNVPPLPPTEPFSADPRTEERETEMQQP